MQLIHSPNPDDPIYSTNTWQNIIVFFHPLKILSTLWGRGTPSQLKEKQLRGFIISTTPLKQGAPSLPSIDIIPDRFFIDR